MLTADEITAYTFVKPLCPHKDKKSNREQGDSKASIVTQRVSAVLTGPMRNVFPLEQIRGFTITSKKVKMHRGTAIYHRDSIFLASTKKSTEPEKETMLSNSITAIKSRPDSSRLNIAESCVTVSINRNIMDTKPVIQAIKKMADVNAIAIFIFINSSPKCGVQEV